jgi:hypothetical protein
VGFRLTRIGLRLFGSASRARRIAEPGHQTWTHRILRASGQGEGTERQQEWSCAA